jgi:peptidoglycan/xylan/chitin deacetylase (PgdA/CDA1 family)
MFRVTIGNGGRPRQSMAMNTTCVRMCRRPLLLSLLGLAACAPRPIPRAAPPTTRRLAVTMDDPNVAQAPLYGPRDRDLAILHALEARRLRAGLFVSGIGVDSPDGAALLARWSDAGHSLGNHSYSHRSLHADDMTVDDFAAELARNEALLAGYPAFRRRFRFPFLKEGNTAAKRDGARAALRAHGYTNGHVTIDASDWAFNTKLVDRLRQRPSADVTSFRTAYIAHMRERANYYDALSVELLGRSVAHTMLVHHSLLNALFLGDLLDALARDGWVLIDVEESYRDPVFALSPDVLPAGESLIWSIAKATPSHGPALRYPGESDAYERAALDRL